MAIYGGPNPRDVDPSFPDHSLDRVTCLVDGSQHKRLTIKYFRTIGYTRETYLEQFPDAPLIAEACRRRYSEWWTDDRKQLKGEELKETRAREDVEAARVAGFRRFLETDDSVEYRRNLSEKAKQQHRYGELTDSVRDYYKERFPGSEHQRQQTERLLDRAHPIHSLESRSKAKANLHKTMANRNPYAKHLHAVTGLMYQSSYEKDFLDHCLAVGLPAGMLDTGPSFYDGNTLYQSDFLLGDRHVVEVKSWYVERLQEQNDPGNLDRKRRLVEDAGYIWLYVKDLDYAAVDGVIAGLINGRP